MKATVTSEASRPLSLDRLHFPEASDRFEPFSAACLMPYNVRTPDEKGNFVEAVTVLAACDNGERVFVKFYRSGNTAWIPTDRLKDER